MMDTAAAESLLRLLGDPASVILSIDDECVLTEHELVRNVVMHLRPDAFPTDDETGGGTARELYVDLLHPDDGTFVDLELVPDPAVRRVDHNEHRAVAEFLIATRFVTVWASVRGVPESERARFNSEMLDAGRALMGIAYAPETAARAIYKQYFDENGMLRIFEAHEQITVNPVRAVGLSRLCLRLVSKYLLLAAVRFEDGLVPPIRFSYRLQVTEYRMGRTKTTTARRRRRRSPQRRETVSRPSWWRKMIASPRRPHAFRIHIPYIKRTNHYTFRLNAPEGYFVAQQEFVAKTARKLVKLKKRSSPFAWSINTGYGQRTQAFATGATEYRQPVYIGVQNLELPGESTSRVFLLTLFVLSGMLGFAALTMFAAGPILDVGVVVLAIASAGAFASSPPKGIGVLGYPLFSRLAPPALGFLAALFVLWITSRVVVVDPRIPTWFRDLVSGAWHLWLDLGWLAIITGAVVVLVHAVRRRAHLIAAYNLASANTYVFSDKMREGT